MANHLLKRAWSLYRMSRLYVELNKVALGTMLAGFVCVVRIPGCWA